MADWNQAADFVDDVVKCDLHSPFAVERSRQAYDFANKVAML